MAVYPGAKYRPLNQFSDAGVRPRVGVVLHVNDSQGNGVTSVNGDSLYNWIAGDNNMSCHFQVSQTGGVEQYVDTDNASWCQMAGNGTYISIETEGIPGTNPAGLTDAQVHACAGIMRWLHDTHGIPLQLAEAPGQRGLGWHGMGGAAWGGHTSCPGDVRKAQRAQILALAKGAPVDKDEPMSAAEVADIKKAMKAQADRIVKEIQHAAVIVVHGKPSDKPNSHPNSQDQVGPVIRQIAADVSVIKNKP